jgi:hypothetical protein
MPTVFADTRRNWSRWRRNTTGFMNAEFGVSAKLLEPLKQVAPNVTRAAVVRRNAGGGGVGQFAAIHAVAFARARNGGLIISQFGAAPAQRNLIIALAPVTGCPRFIPPATSSPMAD